MPEVRMPHLSLGDEDVVVLGWLKSVGEDINIGDPLLEVETEKATMDVEAPVAGTLTAQQCHAGDTISPGALIGFVKAPGDTDDAGESSSETQGDISKTNYITPTRDLPKLPTASASNQLVPDGELRGVPSQRLAASSAMPQQVFEQPKEKSGPYSEQPLPRRRRAIARRLAEAATVPQFAVTRTISLAPAREIVGLLRSDGDASVTDVVLHAVAAVAAQSPNINAWLVGETLRSFQHVCIALAVDTDDGVTAPVLPNVELLSIAEIAKVRSEVVARARSRQLRVDDLEGATLTLSNVGPMGADQLFPMLTPPQVAVVGLGRDSDRGAVFTFIGDHRALDGAEGARFLARLDTALSAPTVN